LPHVPRGLRQSRKFIHRTVGQFLGEWPQCPSLAISPAVFDRYIPALDIAGIGEAPTERD
jgi:hypothetical protein